MSVILMVAGGLILAFGIYQYCKAPDSEYLRLEEEGVPAIAILYVNKTVHTRYSRKRHGGMRSSIEAWITYVTPYGQQYQQQLRFANGKMRTGEEVTIHYDPANPENYILVGEWRKKERASMISVMIVGVLFALVGVALWLFG